MNAADFFSASTYEAIKQDVKNQKVFGLIDTPYQKKIKVRNNTYDFRISAGYYVIEPFSYFVHFSEDHIYPGSYGGSCGSNVNLDSYEAFKDSINRLISRFPDYTQEDNVQLSLF
jgi:hypothetical protein